MQIFLLVSFIITGVFWLYCVYWDFKTAGGRINDQAHVCATSSLTKRTCRYARVSAPAVMI